MFERYAESSRRALFVARQTASSAGAQFIEVDHLVAAAVEMWPVAGTHRAEVLQRLDLMVSKKPPTALHLEIPFSPLVKRMLIEAMFQADRLGHHRIRPEHLLLAVLEEPNCSASIILRDVGIERDVLIQSAAQGAAVDDTPLSYDAPTLRYEIRQRAAVADKVAHSGDRTLTVAKITTLFSSLAAALYAAAQTEPSPIVSLFLSGGPLLAVIIWLQKDARRTGVGVVQDWGYFLLLAWPVVIPWYAFKTRGPSGWRLMSGLLGLIGSAYISWLVVAYLIWYFSAGS